MACKVWHAKEAVVKIAANTDITITTAAALDTFFTAGGTAIISAVMKDFSIKEPIADVDKINLMGKGGDLYQNAEIEEKSPELVEIQGTMLLPGDEYSEQLVYGTGTAISTTHIRYLAGRATIPKVALLLNLDDGTDEVNYAGDDMYMTARDVKVTGADGHFEVSATFKCLPRNWYGPEFKK